MSSEVRGTFSPVHELTPDPNETDWTPPMDIPSQEEILRLNAGTTGASTKRPISSSSPLGKHMQESSISNLFLEVLRGLKGYIAELNSEGAELFRTSNYAAAAVKAEHGKAMRNFHDQVEILQKEWNSLSGSAGLAEPSRADRKPPDSTSRAASRKRPPKKLSVYFGDGTTITAESSSETFAKCISKIGVGLVQQMGIERYGLPLISDIPPGKYGSTMIDGFYILTHFNAEDKKTILHQIGQKAAVHIAASIVD